MTRKRHEAGAGRRSVLRAVGLGAGAALGVGTAAGSRPSVDESRGAHTAAGGRAGVRGGDAVERGAGLVTVDGGESVAATADRIASAVEASEALSLVTRLDHAANAESVGLELPPTVLLVFGNPAVGTPLMRAERTVGIDLPQKLLVWEDDGGAVRVTYNAPSYLAARHGIVGQEERLDAIATALRSLATGDGG